MQCNRMLKYNIRNKMTDNGLCGFDSRQASGVLSAATSKPALMTTQTHVIQRVGIEGIRPWVQGNLILQLTTRLHLVPSLRICGVFYSLSKLHDVVLSHRRSCLGLAFSRTI
jgi:hypothetical protein